MSLMKYTVLINSLLKNLMNSNLCCKLYETPNSPVGDTNDFAQCFLAKNKVDRAMYIVYKHGCTWWHDFNAKKSGVLVCDES